MCSTKCPWLGAVGWIAWGWGGRKETVTVSLCLVFIALVAPATEHLIVLRDFIRALTTWVTESDIHHFAAKAKMASISGEFSGKCFDFDRLSASCLGGWCWSTSKKRLSLIHRKIFHLMDPLQHQDVFSKDLLGEFCQLLPFQGS